MWERTVRCRCEFCRGAWSFTLLVPSIFFVDLGRLLRSVSWGTMNLDTPYQTTHTRAYYQNLHLSYRFGNTTRGVNGPIFSREFCGGSNGNGMIFTQDVRTSARSH